MLVIKIWTILIDNLYPFTSDLSSLLYQITWYFWILGTQFLLYFQNLYYSEVNSYLQIFRG